MERMPLRESRNGCEVSHHLGQQDSSYAYLFRQVPPAPAAVSPRVSRCPDGRPLSAACASSEAIARAPLAEVPPEYGTIRSTSRPTSGRIQRRAVSASSAGAMTPVVGRLSAASILREQKPRSQSDFVEHQRQQFGGVPLAPQGQPRTPEQQRAQMVQQAKSKETPPKIEAPHAIAWGCMDNGRASFPNSALKVPPGMLRRVGKENTQPMKENLQIVQNGHKLHLNNEGTVSREPLKLVSANIEPVSRSNMGSECLEPLKEFDIKMPKLGVAAASRSTERLPSALRRALNFIRDLPAMPHTVLPQGVCPFLPSVATTGPQKPTLVLDLDETLIHCARGDDRGSSPGNGQAAPELIVQFDDTDKFGHVYFRPFVQFFLEVAAKSFELVVFTASQQSYADKVINVLDPTGTLISHRLYRQHCTELRGAYFKELGLLGRPLSRCLLVDNSAISVACNPDNGVMIRSWYSDRDDRELVELIELLQDLLNANCDVGTFLSARYGLHKFFQGLRDGADIKRLY